MNYAPLFNTLTYEEYVKKIEEFHGTVAPGLLLGGFMVDLAYKNLPKESLIDIFCETKACLPDAIQLLTPCTYGNGWLRILDLGRFAAVFYDKHTGLGVRLYVDISRLEAWPEVKNWFLKLKSKQEQNKDLLLEQMRAAGTSVFGVQKIKVRPEFLKKQRMGATALCPKCGESFPASQGMVCRGCAEELPYNIAG